jgi:hypothetical protein
MDPRKKFTPKELADRVAERETEMMQVRINQHERLLTDVDEILETIRANRDRIGGIAVVLVADRNRAAVKTDTGQAGEMISFSRSKSFEQDLVIAKLMESICEEIYRTFGSDKQGQGLPSI